MRSRMWISVAFFVAIAGASILMPQSAFAVNLPSATYEGVSFPIAYVDTSPQGITFNTDGTKMFVVGIQRDYVNEFTLSVAFDVSTANFNQRFSVAAQEGFARDVAFNSNGTKMFVVGDNDAVYEYTLSTGFDVSTASFADSFAIASGEGTDPTGIDFNTGGTTMFVVGNSGDSVYEYALSTGFDVSTASFSASTSISAEDSAPTGVVFSTDGTSMFMIGSGGDAVYEYALSTGFDVSTASFSASTSVSSQDTLPNGLAFNADGSKMFVVGGTGIEVNEYALSVNFDVTTASFVDVLTLTGHDGQPRGMTFNDDGTKVFVVGAVADSVFEFDLPTAFDIAYISFVQSFSISGQEINPQDVEFNTDGTKMFVVGNTGDDVNEYTLSTGFDVSTASFVDLFSVATQDLNPQGLAFNTDGTKMFVVGKTNVKVYEYDLSTGFDVSTASFSASTSVAADTADPLGLAFNVAGTEMFLSDNDDDTISQYDLSTAFDVTTASFSTSTSIAAQDSNPAEVAFSTDGSRMFLVGFTNGEMYQYSLTTAPDAPTGLSATTVSDTAINLSWTAPDDGGSAITGYLIERKVAAGAFSTLVADTASTDTTYSDTGLTAETLYTYRVSAINAVGTSATSSEAFATTDAAPVEETPAGSGGGYGIYIAPSTPGIPTPTGEPTTANLQIQVIQLRQLINNLLTRLGLPPLSPFSPGSPFPTPGTYTRNLTLRNTGADVTSLQAFLIQKNAGPAAKALATVGTTGYFGPMTQAALAEYQASVGISPAVGYFGPITRAHVRGL